MSQSAPSSATPSRANPAKRKRLFLLMGFVVLLAALLFAVWWWLIGSHSVSTDNAYVQADTAQITPLVSGAVVAVKVADTQAVAAGDVLVVIDDADAKLAVASAEAAFGQAQRRVQQYYANGDALAAQSRAQHAAIVRAGADLIRARIDLKRRQDLVGTGAVSGEELTEAQNQIAVARAALEQAQAQNMAAQQNQKSAEALVVGTDAATNPEVQAAQARLDQAKLDLQRTVLRAPIDGIISQRRVELGQRVAVGNALMSVVPIQDAYVEANFKEVQLERVRSGQKVTLESDLYGGHVVYHGRVIGFSGGTGAAFSIIPAQNATGNWIKVVQRVPVRISLERQELRAHPLRVGLSMAAKIDLDSTSAP